MRQFFLIVTLVTCHITGQSQIVKNVRYNYNTKEMVIIYDLQSSHDNIPCLVYVKYSSKVRKIDLKEVNGDVGNLVYPGKDKKITWNYTKELVHALYEGEVSLLVDAKPNVQVLGKVKRQGSIKLGIDTIYSKNKIYSFKLYRNDKEIYSFEDSKIEDSSIVLKIPKEIRARKNYQIRISGGEEVYFGNEFKIKPKVGMAWKVIPILAVPVYLIVSNYLDDNKDLPGPPDPN